jgi:hypothetical protein
MHSHEKKRSKIKILQHALNGTITIDDWWATFRLQKHARVA